MSANVENFPRRLAAPAQDEFEPILRGPYKATDELRKRVRRMTMLGVPAGRVARDLGLTLKELRHHYADELEKGDVESMTTVSMALWKNAVEKNNVIAQIAWLKMRNGWIDRKEINHTLGPAMSHEDRLAMLEAPPTQTKKTIRQEVLEGTADIIAEYEAEAKARNSEGKAE